MIFEAKFTEAEQELNANFGTYAMVGGKTDLNYDPNSKNAQSGIAVEQAVANKVDKEEGKTLYRGMEVIYEHTITEDEVGIDKIIITTDMNGNTFKLDEIYLSLTTGGALETDATKNTTGKFNGKTSIGYYWFTNLFKKGHARMQAYGKRVKEKYWCNQIQPPCTALYNGSWYGSYTSSDVDYVTQFDISGLADFNVGARIVICGRRVD